ncbi:MAG: SUMF1/EgtB/PvdO family nonheme iron enzyme [Chloroflexales bacterium]|nr:SUMF1/EgtB/PvdO family nonheme iron enzyme [Chloroflexales bacterium]
MSRKEEIYIVMGLILALSSCAAAWLALPQFQLWLADQLRNPLFLPLVLAVLVALLFLLALLLLLRDRIIAWLRALLPRNRPELAYLRAVEQTYGKTPALLAGSTTASHSDLSLTEAFNPLTLRPDRDDSLGSAEERQMSDLEAVEARRAARLRAYDTERRTPAEQVVYWGLWALAQGFLLIIAGVVIGWLLWSPDNGWRLDERRIVVALLLGGLWFFGAFRLHAWLVAKDDVLAALLTWRRRRSECVADPDTPGAEIWAHPRLLIRGDPGSGKTTLLRHLAVICAREQLGMARQGPGVRTLYGWPQRLFPIYIPLRALELSLRDSDLLAAYGEKLRLLLNRDLSACNAGFFAGRLERGGCLVLLDAFDELRDLETRGLAGRLIAALPPGPRRRPNRFVVTSRVVGYEGQLNGEGYVRRRVNELGYDQAERFIQARYAAIAAIERRALARELSWDHERQAANLIRRLPNNPGLRRLSRNPLLLSLTVALHYDHRGKGLQLPEERYRLYEEALHLMVRDWERRKDVDMNLEPTDDRSDLNLDERMRLLRELAWMMFELSANSADVRAHAVVRGSQVRAKLAEVLALLPGFAPEKTGAARSVHARSEAERWQQNIGQRGGVLQELGNVPGSNDVEIQFAHLTFQEYLAARAAASEDGERRLARILENWARPTWREVVLLYAASHEATPVIRHLLAQIEATRTLLAGAVLLERPINLSPELQDRTLDRLRSLVFADTAASAEQAVEALRQLEERAALPEPAALLQAFTQAPHGPVRARALELALDHRLMRPERDSDAAPAPPPELLPALLHTVEHDPHHLPRLAAGYLLAGSDPRYNTDNAWRPELVHIPAGPFLMGSSAADPVAGEDEQPQHRLELPDYWIGKYPVTVAQWRCFVADGGYTTRTYWTAAGWRFINGAEEVRPWYARLLPFRHAQQPAEPDVWPGPESGDDNLPVTEVSWYEAVAYCRWLSAQTGIEFRLPTEAEWEKAARGPDGLIWPWGNIWEDGRCNSREAGLGRPSPVGSFPSGASPYGVMDLAGNVWEWCATEDGKDYPYTLEDEWSVAYLEQDNLRRLRGGAFWSNRKHVRGASRISGYPRNRDYDIGLRVASHSSLPGSES